MLFLESILIALRSLIANRLRSILTLIGIIIGVMTVIAVMSILAGMDRYMAERFSSLGSTTFVVDKVGVITNEDDWFKAQKRKDLTVADYKAIRDNCPECEAVGMRAFSSGQVKYRNQVLKNVYLLGATANFVRMVDMEANQGRFISDFEDEHRAPVAFVGEEIINRLFPKLDPIGKEIKVNEQPYTIVGVSKKRGSFLGQNQDNFVVIPFGMYQKRYFRNPYLSIFVKAPDYPAVQKAQDRVRLILRARRHVQYHAPDDFGFITSEGLMDTWHQITGLSFVVMIGISSISLIVGGIVIMNIMLVSVTERTREIGIRKAIGARRRNIMLQFLVEAVTLAVMGGVVGILLGLLIAKMISLTSPLPSAVSGLSIALGITISSAVGIFFGIYPAMRAARLDPIEALRYE